MAKGREGEILRLSPQNDIAIQLFKGEGKTFFLVRGCSPNTEHSFEKDEMIVSRRIFRPGLCRFRGGKLAR